MSNCNDWQHISTVPAHRVVRLGKFPAPAEMATKEWLALFSVSGDEVVRLGITDATHWRDTGPAPQATHK